MGFSQKIRKGKMKTKIRIGIIIPDRNDRPELLQNCIRMMEAQTVEPEIIMIVNDPPVSDECDITWRYRTGYDRLRNKGLDCILLIENDDWYSPDYIETMVTQWESAIIPPNQYTIKYPQILGTCYTIYYHLQLRSWFKMEHFSRASAMNTLLKPDLDIQWPADNDPYTDLHLWKQLEGYTFLPEKRISIGMKHGIGKCGGKNHKDNLHRFINDDRDFLHLYAYLDSESFKFYTKLKFNG